ncbi:hypothetical protein AB833_00340 [Chromatiales bacterium (ex Bugula neritina AB1)]|nr:hypothetical protein AB833_00340 [Chromatiales bacterium (ex Bugula neritina AB1)]
MKRLLTFSATAFVISICTVGFTAKIKNVGTIKIENSPAHFAVNNCHIGKYYEEVHFYAGSGVLADGKKFEISADGSGGWVEMHVGIDSGSPEAFYTSTLKNPQEAITVQSKQVVIRGRFDEAISDTSGIPFELTASCEG